MGKAPCSTTSKSNTDSQMGDMPGYEIYSLRQIGMRSSLAQCYSLLPALLEQGSIRRKKPCHATTWKSLLQGWVKSCYGELIRSHMALSTLPGGLAFIAYGLMPLGFLLHALYSGKVLRLSTLLAGLALLAQIDAKRCFDREYDLAFPWSLAAPVSWVACGILLLDVARLILTGRGADWKGRQLILFPGVSHWTGRPHA